MTSHLYPEFQFLYSIFNSLVCKYSLLFIDAINKEIKIPDSLWIKWSTMGWSIRHTRKLCSPLSFFSFILYSPWGNWEKITFHTLYILLTGKGGDSLWGSRAWTRSFCRKNRNAAIFRSTGLFILFFFVKNEWLLKTIDSLN